MHISFKIIKFYITLRCSTCFGHHRVHHQERDTRESSSNNRIGLEDATETTPHGDQRLHVQWRKAPDDGHGGVRNMLSNVE
jgi:hypothetical protein